MKLTQEAIEKDALIHAHFNKAFVLLNDVDKLDFRGSYLKEISKNPFFKRDNDIRKRADRCGAKLAIGILSDLLEEIENEYVYELRAEAHYSLNDYKKAIDDFSKALSIDPHLFLSYNNRGVAYSKVGKTNLSIRDYDIAIRLSPQELAPYFNRGQSRFVLDEIEGALYDYNKALEIDPEDVEVLYARALAREKCNDFAGAIADLTKAIGIYRIDHYEEPFSFYAVCCHAYELRSKCHVKMGHKIASKSDWDKCQYYSELMRKTSGDSLDSERIPC